MLTSSCVLTCPKEEVGINVIAPLVELVKVRNARLRPVLKLLTLAQLLVFVHDAKPAGHDELHHRLFVSS